MPISDNIRGALFMTGSMAAFTVNDAFMKSLSGVIPLYQAIFLRGLGVVVVLVVFCAVTGQLTRRLPRRDWGLVALRTVAEMTGAVLFLTALFNMPFANVSAILQALPLTVSLAGALFLGEALGWRRLTAILVGLAGVLLIVRPGGADFNVYSLAAIAAVLVVTVRDLTSRRMSREVPSVLVALMGAIGVALLGGALSLTEPWAPVTPFVWQMLAGAILFILGGYVFSVSAMRVGEIAFVAPFRYTSLLVALILGFVVFGEVPGWLTLTGAGIVVATGLFTLYREAKLKARHPRGLPGRLR